MADSNALRQFTAEHECYLRKAEWAERFALALFGAMVLQQIVDGTSLLNFSVLSGLVVTAGAYYNANRLLNRVKNLDNK
jgi:hypothetical protein